MKRYAYSLLIALSVITLDQATKYLIVSSMSAYDSIGIFSFLHIVNVRNTGAAFGIFRGLGSGFFIVISLSAIILLGYMIIKDLYNRTGLSLILGGAVGNLIDRIYYGNVVDFIDVSVGRYHWPAFNVADSALTVGIVIIIFSSLLKKER
jgi:signal peptidase II